MYEHAVLLTGVFVVISGVVLAFLNRRATILLPIITLGIVCVIVGGTKGLQKLVFKLAGIETTINLQEALKDGALITQVEVASINQKILKLSDFMEKQNEFNQKAEQRIVNLDNKLNLSSEQLQSNVSKSSATVEKNSKFTVLVFFKHDRAADAKLIQQELLKAGYQSSAINSDLSETTVSPQTGNSNFIAYTKTGETIIDNIRNLLSKEIPKPRNETINVGGPWSLRRGDAQIYMF